MIDLGHKGTLRILEGSLFLAIISLQLKLDAIHVKLLKLSMKTWDIVRLVQENITVNIDLSYLYSFINSLQI